MLLISARGVKYWPAPDFVSFAFFSNRPSYKSPVVMSWDLGKGETEVISYASLNPGFHVIIDDAAARRCAKTLGVHSLGTLGVLLLAKRRGVISSIKPALAALQDAGLWLGDDVIAMVLSEAGE